MSEQAIIEAKYLLALRAANETYQSLVESARKNRDEELTKCKARIPLHPLHWNYSSYDQRQTDPVETMWTIGNEEG